MTSTSIKKSSFRNNCGKGLFKIFWISSILALLIISGGCGGRCDNLEPPLRFLKFTLIDETTGLSLIGPDRLYHPDTISQLNRQRGYIGVYRDSLLYFNYEGISSGEKEAFFLNSFQSDTLLVGYSFDVGRCGTFIDLKEFRYNDRTIFQEDNLYEVVLSP